LQIFDQIDLRVIHPGNGVGDLTRLTRS
jgi:hypothetical protein